MKLETFFDMFDKLADTPNAVGKIRELILQLAASGKIVEQSIDDEPASALLSRIQEHNEKLRSRKEFRGSPVAPLDRDELPKIPSCWEWVRLGDVVDYGSSDRAESVDIPENAWLLDLEDIEKDTSRLLRRKTFRESPSKSTKTTFSVGDVLYGKLRPYLNKVVVAHASGYCTTEIMPIRAFGFIDPAYLCYALKRPEFIAYANSKSYGMNLPRLGTEDARSAPFPLPSLAEQKRIVAKVDELMALCDRLEAQQQKRKTRLGDLARASLARFAEAPTPANLDFLFHHSYAISPADLRKSILTLAVQGKLVPQDPNDEPALETFGGLKPISDALTTEADTPNQWAICTYRSLTTLVTSGSRGWKQFYSTNGSIFVRTQNIKTDRLILDDVAFVDLPKLSEGMRAQVLKDDILITITGANVTKAARVKKQIPEAYVSQHIALTRPRWSEMSEWLHLCFISHGAARRKLEQLAYGDKPGLNLNNIRDLMIPVPPRAEQRRIVAKVGELMTLVDALETQLATVHTAAEKLLTAVVAQLVDTSAREPKLPAVETATPTRTAVIQPKPLNRHFSRAVLSAEIVHRLHAEPTFGRVKHQKIFHLCEHIAQIDEIEGQYHREAAGPLDNRLIYANEAELKRQQWYVESKRSSSYGHAYQPLEKAGNHRKYLEEFWSAKIETIKGLIELMRGWNTERCEIFSTAYAAWNDLLIWKEEPTLEAILHEILERWNPAKRRFPRERWLKAIEWIRKNGYAPTGFGKPTAENGTADTSGKATEMSLTKDSQRL